MPQKNMKKEEVRTLNASKPALNKSMVAARKLKGSVVVYDPQYM